MRHRNVLLTCFALTFALLALPAVARASGVLVIRAVGSSQGVIAGTSTLQGYENWIEAFSFSHAVSVPIGPNGLPSGAPQTSPLSIMCRFDRSTIKLFTAQANLESFSEFRLEWVDSGTGETLIRYELFDGVLIDAQESGSTGGDIAPTLSLSFVYAQVEITDMTLGTSVIYEWNSAPAAAPETLAKGLLLSPAPNPTHGQTAFRFSLPADSNAELTLYDLRGHLVRNLYSGWTSAEPTVAEWDGTDDSGRKVAQGMYVARLKYPGREITQRITVLR